MQYNDKGERHSEFIMTTKTTHGYSQFQKSFSRHQAQESPARKNHIEIDQITVSKAFFQAQFAVVPEFITRSFLLQRRFSLTRRGKKAAKFIKGSLETIIDWDLCWSAFAKTTRECVSPETLLLIREGEAVGATTYSRSSSQTDAENRQKKSSKREEQQIC
ncbi:hypothetical protein RB195_015401 [Necator americanus]|uniref:Uncharacterized protein n=1 Tax=Necator americanus TaxID=51031 RepID=A0ABR1E4E5_NECAM